MADKKDCSPVPDSVPTNAFHPEFLKALQVREDSPLAAIEAETRGPWQVIELPPGSGNDPEAERWIVLRSWEKPEEVEPCGTFRYREHALLWAAALEVAARRGTLNIGLERDDEGHVVEQWTVEQGCRTIGHLTLWDEPLTAALDVLEALLRCPDALARVLDAGGPYIAELLGRRLMAG